MTRQGISTVPVLLTLDRSNGATLAAQIYDALLGAIREGRWRTGSRLPGSRVLADDLGVSRSTILSVYERLRAEGYIESNAGAGTRVSGVLSEPQSLRPVVPRRAAGASRDSLRCAPVVRARARRSSVQLAILSKRMIAAYGDLKPRREASCAVPFSLGVPALDVFPVTTWARLTARRWRTTPHALLAADDGPGYLQLRQAIADSVVRARALRCALRQIVITAGNQQAFDLVSRLLLNPGDAVWVNEYGYQPARAAFAGAGAELVDIPVDDEGLDVERAMHLAPDARIAFVTPACEPPFCVSMSVSRRRALLDWAVRTGSWIIEDDYNGELQYEGKLTAALQGMAHPGAERVIYLRTFTKTLFPALRLGYAVLPEELVEPFTQLRVISDRHSPTAEQAVLTDFIGGGHFARHIRKLRELNADRQHSFLELASRDLAGLLQFRPAAAGIRLVGFLPADLSDRRVAAEAARCGVIVEPLSRPGSGHPARNGLIFGYAPFRRGEIRRGFARLAEVIRAVRAADRGTG